MEYTLYALAAMLLFGLSRIMYLRASRESSMLEEQTFLLPLYLAGAGIMLPIGLIGNFTLGDVATGVILSVLSLAGAVSLYRALRLSSPSIVNVILGLNFLVPLAFGLGFLRETLTQSQLIGLGLALLVVLISAVRELKTRTSSRSTRMGVLYALITFFTWGLLGVVVRLMSMSSLLLNFAFALGVMYSLCAVMLIPFALEQALRTPIREVARGVLAGIFGALGSYLSAYCYAFGSVSVTALILRFSYLLPVAYAVFKLREPLDRMKIAIIILSVIAVILLTL